MSIRLLFTFAIIAAVSASAQSTTVTRTSGFSFPLIGLASTETLGVNLINLAANPTNGNAASCTGSVTFINQAGTTIGSAQSFTLAANAATVVTLPFSSSGITGSRGLVRTIVSTTTTNNVPCSLSYSLNTYDTSSGVTHVFIQGAPPPVVQSLTVNHP